MVLYTNHPLHHSDSIRLLDLYPGNGDDVVKILIRTVRLSAKPSFVALSYTWDNPFDKHHPSYREYDIINHRIFCAGEQLAVKQNLYEALWQLRERGESASIWVDAICVNQANNQERNQQLSLMPYIYCDASQVVIWLGKEDPTVNEVIQCLRANEESLLVQSSLSLETTPEFLKGLPVVQKRALAILFRRRWFSRIWTLQEVLLPTRTTCLCGPYELDIEAAGLFAVLILHTHLERQPLIRATSGYLQGFDNLSTNLLGGAACASAWQGLTRPAGGFGSRALLRYPQIDDKMEIPRKLKWLVALELFVHEARQRDCSKLEDKVLAPLAFALHEKFAPDNSTALLEEARKLIDTRVPAKELYTKFTRFMIESMANLDIISRTSRSSPSSGCHDHVELCSWVPPFHEGGTTALIDELLFTKYNAAAYLGQFHELKSFQKEYSELRVRAVFFGRILHLSTHVASADDTNEWFAKVCDSERYKAEVKSGIRHDLAHTVTQRLGPLLLSCAEREAKKRRKKREWLRYVCSSISIIQLNASVSQRTMRRLFIFEIHHQRLIGLSPVQAQESDHLCILQGAKTPFIVRETQKPGKYRLLGEAFAENFMHGEVECLGFADREIDLV